MHIFAKARFLSIITVSVIAVMLGFIASCAITRELVLEPQSYPAWVSEFEEKAFTETEKLEYVSKMGNRFVVYTSDDKFHYRAVITRDGKPLINSATDLAGDFAFYQEYYVKPPYSIKYLKTPLELLPGEINEEWFDEQGRLIKSSSLLGDTVFSYSKNAALCVQDFKQKDGEGHSLTLLSIDSDGCYSNPKKVSEFEAACALDDADTIKMLLGTVDDEAKSVGLSIAIKGNASHAVKLIMESMGEHVRNAFMWEKPLYPLHVSAVNGSVCWMKVPN